MNTDDATAITRARYDRIAPIYDAVEWVMELRARAWRRRLWSRAAPGRLLELGVGTGKNLRYYGTRQVIALDLSAAMLARARRRAARLGVEAEFQTGDVQRLPYADGSFDVVVAAFLFCSVPDPVLGLTEVKRVLSPGGQLLLLEHVLSHKPMLRPLMQWFDPISAWCWGAHINRDTIANVERAGLRIVATDNLSLDVVKLIEASKD